MDVGSAGLVWQLHGIMEETLIPSLWGSDVLGMFSHDSRWQLVLSSPGVHSTEQEGERNKELDRSLLRKLP